MGHQGRGWVIRVGGGSSSFEYIEVGVGRSTKPDIIEEFILV